MAIKDFDKLFKNKVQEYYTLELASIQKQLGNLRDKTIALEQLRKENLNRIKELYAVTSDNHHNTDLYRYLLIGHFFKIYRSYATNQVTAFLQDELPKLKLVAQKKSEPTLGLNSEYGLDLKFFRHSTNEDILELIAKAFVFETIEIFLFQHLHKEYVSSERKDKLQNLMDHKCGSLKDYEEEEEIINSDFPDFSEKIYKCLNFKLVKDIKEPFQINLPKDKADEYIKKLHGLLMDNLLIEVSLEEFTTHFKDHSFSKIVWFGKKTPLVYLIENLNFKNQNVHKVTLQHFCDKYGNDYKDTLSVLKQRSIPKTSSVEKILQEMFKFC